MADEPTGEHSLGAYLQLARGLGLLARDRALSSETGERLARFADEVALAGRANRELVERLIAVEVDKTAERLGFVRPADLVDLQGDVAELRAEVAELRAEVVRLQAAIPPDPT